MVFIMGICIKGYFLNISIVNAHTATELVDANAKNISYDHLEAIFDHLPSYDTKILLTDFSEKIIITKDIGVWLARLASHN